MNLNRLLKIAYLKTHTHTHTHTQGIGYQLKHEDSHQQPVSMKLRGRESSWSWLNMEKCGL